MKRRQFIVAGAAAAATLSTGFPVRSQGTLPNQVLPNRPIRIYVPFAAGGSTDGSARLFAEKLSRILNRTVIIENRPGAAGALSIATVAQAEPDGCSLLFGTATTHVFIPQTTNLRERPITDVPPISILAQESCSVAINSQVPVSTLQEFIAYLKQRPGEINYGTSGAGGLAHYAAEMFNMLAGTKMTHIPYKGGSQMAPDWAANRVQVSCGSTSSSIPFYREGKVRILAVCAETRQEGLSEIPTSAEAGLPGLIIGTFHALCAPAATPKPIVDAISEGARKAVADGDFKTRLIRQGVQPMPGLTPAEATNYVQALSDRLAPVIKAVSAASAR